MKLWSDASTLPCVALANGRRGNRVSCVGLLVAFVLVTTTPVLAASLDLSTYRCTRTDDGSTASGNALADAGFRILSQARFGSVNLMMVNPKTHVRANCFARAHPK